MWVRYNNASWSNLNGVSAARFGVGNIDADAREELVADFGPTYGVWIYRNNTSWTQLHTLPSQDLIVGDLDGNGRGEVSIDFGPSSRLVDLGQRFELAPGTHGQSKKDLRSRTSRLKKEVCASGRGAMSISLRG